MDTDYHLQNAKRLTRLLDTKFKIAGLNFGIDPLLNIFPALGNIVGSITSLYIFWIALKLGLPGVIYLRMLGNIALDYIFGLVPIAGVVFDMFYKSNVRNLKLIEGYVGKVL